MRETNEEMESEQSATAKMTEIAHTLALDQVDNTVWFILILSVSDQFIKQNIKLKPLNPFR